MTDIIDHWQDMYETQYKRLLQEEIEKDIWHVAFAYALGTLRFYAGTTFTIEEPRLREIREEALDDALKFIEPVWDDDQTKWGEDHRNAFAIVKARLTKGRSS